MILENVVSLSHTQLIFTTSCHFVFIALTLGLSLLLVILEALYLSTGQAIYKTLTQFWGRLFGLNFILSLASGIVLTFQLMTNWAYFSHYVGDIVGIAFATSNLLLFFLATTFIRLFFRGWAYFSKFAHFGITCVIAIGTHLSLWSWIVALAWLQNPVGAQFNVENLRMELTDFTAVLNNPLAQFQFLQTLAASYGIAAAVVLGISAYYLLQQREIAIAKPSLKIAAYLGAVAMLSFMALATVHTNNLQRIPIETAWQTNSSSLHSLQVQHKQRIHQGLKAYALLQSLRDEPNNPTQLIEFKRYQANLGYALLLKAYTDKPEKATAAQIDRAVQASLPAITPLFWMYQVMIISGWLSLALFLVIFISGLTQKYPPWLLYLTLYAMPLPWLTSEISGFIYEVGGQPWLVLDILPTFLGMSTFSLMNLSMSLLIYTLFYIGLLWFDIVVLRKLIREGTDCELQIT